MRTGTITAIIVVLTISHVMISGCKKTETTPVAAPPVAGGEQARQQKQMLKKSYEESKKAVAAKVNGQAITMFSLLREMNALAPQYLAQGRQRTPELREEIRKHALDILISQELAVQEARKRGMKAKPEAVDNEIKRIKAEKGSEEAFQSYLGDSGLTEKELRKIIEQDHLFEMIAEKEIESKITVTEAALRERYEREKAKLKKQDAPHGSMTFEEARGVLEQNVRAEEAEKRMQEWQKELRKNARIEIAEQRPAEGK
jgi:hypothetical protein